MTHLDTSNTSYGQKKGRELNYQIWLSTIKNQESPWFPYVQVACAIGKLLTKAKTLLETSFQLEVCTQSYGPPKLWESQLWEFRDSHLGILGQNDIWVLVLWPCTKYTIRGKVVASPKFESWRVLWICVCLWLVRAPNYSNYALTNLLFGLCKSVWAIELLVNLSNPI